MDEAREQINQEGAVFEFDSQRKLPGSDGFNRSRRNFLIQSGRVTAAAGVAILMSGCLPEGAGSTERKNTELTVSNSLREKIEPTQEQILLRVGKEYIKKYGCPQPKVSFDYANLAAEIQYQTDGRVAATLEITEPGKILIDIGQVLEGKSRNEQNLYLWKITAHAMTHACKTNEPAQLVDKEMILVDGSRVTGYHGLSVMVETAEKTQTGFNLMEEGTAEALAVKLGEDMNYSYTVGDSRYHRLGQLTLNIMNSYLTREELLARMCQTNDLLGFVRIVTGRRSPKQQDLERVMEWYKRAWKGDDLTVIGKEITEYRGK